MADPKWKSGKQKSSPSNQFIRFTGLGFQWLLTFGVFGWLGYLLDTRINTLPLFTLLFVIIALIGNIYLAIRSSKE